jgi:hypothetical protein
MECILSSAKVCGPVTGFDGGWTSPLSHCRTDTPWAADRGFLGLCSVSSDLYFCRVPALKQYKDTV